jgi:hypothetical protein
MLVGIIRLLLESYPALSLEARSARRQEVCSVSAGSKHDVFSKQSLLVGLRSDAKNLAVYFLLSTSISCCSSKAMHA